MITRLAAWTLVVLIVLICLSATLVGCQHDNGQVRRAALPDACFADLEVLKTEAGVEFVRTPDACFASLPGWPFEPRYVEIDGLRQAYVEEGPPDGPVVVLLHGQPTWGHLYRKMIPVLAEGGLRVIAMDHLGMGRSDKPTDLSHHSFLAHVDRFKRFLDALELQEVTLFAQDWGSVIGLYVVGTDPERFGRVVIADGALPNDPAGTVRHVAPDDPKAAANRFYQMIQRIPRKQPSFYDDNGERRLSGDPHFFSNWIEFSRNDDRFKPSLIVEAMTYYAQTDDVLAAYDEPFPSRITMAAPRTFPGLARELPGITEEAWVGLKVFDKPFLTLWADNDPGQLGGRDAQAALVDNIPGARGQPHRLIEHASHFIQDDQGEVLARHVVAFVRGDVTSQESEATP